MKSSLWMTAALCSTLALGACSSTRLGNTPTRSAAAAPSLNPAVPVEAGPSGPVEAAPLPPIESQPLGTVAGAPAAPGMTPAPGGTDIAALPPAAPPDLSAAPAPAPARAPAAASSRTAMVGNWSAQEASGKSCRIQLSSAPALDLYRASASGCSSQDLSKVNAWDFRNGEVYLYQTGGAVAARLRGSSASLSGVLAKSGAPLSLAR
jgi:hypothetical protein